MTEHIPTPPSAPKRSGRPPGLPRTPGSGRKKGVPNKLNGTIHDMMKALGCDPRMILARIAMNPKNSPELRRKCASDLMNFMYPRLASTEAHVTGEIQQTVVQVISGIARCPGDAPLSPAEEARWRSMMDITPAVEALPAPDEASPAQVGTALPNSDEIALPNARPWHPTPLPVETPRPVDPRADSKHDDRLQFERRNDSKLSNFNRHIDGSIT